MAKYVLLDENNTVTNVVVWDGDDGWSPPPDVTPVEIQDDENVAKGDVYNPKSRKISKPEIPYAPVSEAQLLAQKYMQ